MLFFVMVTLTEQKWIILRERQGAGESPPTTGRSRPTAMPDKTA